VSHSSSSWNTPPRAWCMARTAAAKAVDRARPSRAIGSCLPSRADWTHCQICQEPWFLQRNSSHKLRGGDCRWRRGRRGRETGGKEGCTVVVVVVVVRCKAYWLVLFLLLARRSWQSNFLDHLLGGQPSFIFSPSSSPSPASPVRVAGPRMSRSERTRPSRGSRCRVAFNSGSPFAR
jgi:hypothetical protein